MAVKVAGSRLGDACTRLLGEGGDLVWQVEKAVNHLLLCSQTNLLLIQHSPQRKVSLTPVWPAADITYCCLLYTSDAADE